MPRVWTADEILQAMRDWEVIFGSPPSATDWKLGWGGTYPHYETVRLHFGKWSVAKQLAFPPPPKRHGEWTREQCVQSLREYADEHDGLRPPGHELGGGELPSAATLIRLFGTMPNAWRAAGLVVIPSGVNRRAIAKYKPLRRESARREG